MFHVGQKVICIKQGPWKSHLSDIIVYDPKFGGIYTIRDIRRLRADEIELLFEEVVNPLTPFKDGSIEIGYHPEAFRPIVERKTDISVFRSLLNPTPQQVRESIGMDLGFTREEIGEA